MGDVRTIAGRYELRAELASGGMATVHVARQLGAGGFARIVAVKRLHERYARDPDFVAMFVDEARLVARIRHPNVVQTLDVVADKGEHGGAELFIVMEYVHGESLVALLIASRKRDQPVPLDIASAILVGALHGLHEAHEARSELGAPLGIVHRDVSPHNVLVGIDGVARVLDFGVAKATERVSSTEDGRIKGKLSYMAPEQIAGKDVDRRTDVFAAGVVLWELLAGRKLFVAPNQGAVINMLLSAKVDPPSRHNGHVTPALDAVVMKSLARDAENRFATAREFATALAAAVPPATQIEVGSWVRAVGAADLEAKTRLIETVEATASSRHRVAEETPRSIAARPSTKTEVMADPTPPPSRPIVAHTAPMPIRPAAPMGPEPARRTGAVIGVAVGVLLMGAGGFAALRFRHRPAPVAPAASASVIAAPACPSGMVAIPSGTFTMGSDERKDEKPAHRVKLGAFCLDRDEVSAADYAACSARGSCLRAGRDNDWPDITAKEGKWFDPLCNVRDEARANHPVNCVDWSMANHYCEEQGKRLPTEAEWEYAARGGDDRRFPWGSDAPSAKRMNGCGSECAAWQKKLNMPVTGALYSEDDGYPNTAPVGSFPDGQSRWGAEDLAGNVAEWVADFHAPYSGDDATDPKGPESGKEHVVRGGSWLASKADDIRPTSRARNLPSSRSHAIGFRCAK